MIPNIDESWRPITSLLYEEPLKTLNEQILTNCSYQPKKENIFNVFQMPVNKIKVVVLGQDPYPTPGDAIGRAFAVSGNTKAPVSLKIIYKELCTTTGLMPRDYNVNEIPYYWKLLQHWQDQGVFLLNTALTVETGKAGSHLKYWEEFTKRVISHISTTQPCIWLLWGKKAEKFIPFINKNPFFVKNYDKETIKSIPSNEDWNYILSAPHPAAEAYMGGNAGFYGCNHFIYTNEILKNLKKQTINW